MSAYETLTHTIDDEGVALLTLNRPDQLNAFNVTMARELRAFFENDAASDDVRAVVVTGSGRAFCAGMDLSAEGNVFGLDESLQPTLETMRREYDQAPYEDGVRDTGGKVTLAIHRLPKPVIAAINGPAVGIGATMTLAMDVRLVSPRAKIGFVFGKLGIVPEAASSWFLPRIVGTQTALDWIYSAEILDAESAHAGRLVRSIHPEDRLVSDAVELATSYVSGRSAVAIGLSKRLIQRNSGVADPLEAHLAESLAMFYTSIGDGKEGVQAFREKRQPRFTTRGSDVPDLF